METAPEYTNKPIQLPTPRKLDSTKATVTMTQVMQKLRTESIDRKIEFVTDCELGFTSDMLIRKYIHGEDFTLVIPVTLPSAEISEYFQKVLADDEDDD